MEESNRCGDHSFQAIACRYPIAWVRTGVNLHVVSKRIAKFVTAMKDLSIDEIKNWRAFEDLVADYFREAQRIPDTHVESVEIKQTGTGPDGGRDILVKLKVNDAIERFERKWVVQCKFLDRNVGKADLADVNIPTLVHEHGADGYLLVCKHHLTAQLADAFERLSENCRFGYQYVFWNQNSLLSRIRSHDRLISHYFPEHYRHLVEQRMKGGLIQ